MKGSDLRRMKESLGAAGLYNTIADLLAEKKLAPEDFSLRELWEACVGPTGETLKSRKRYQPGRLIGAEEILSGTLKEADAGTALFATVTGALVATKVMEAYSVTDGFIGDKLVTVMQSRLKDERVPGFTSLEGPKEVPEGHPYDESTFEDKYVTTTQAKKGRILSVTEEAVYMDQTGQLLLRASRIGEATRQEQEKTIVQGVIDTGSNIYRPSGTAEQLYATDASNSNYMATDTPLTDWTDVQEALTWYAQNVTDDRAGTGEPLVMMPRVVLTSYAKHMIARRICTATQVESRTNSAAEVAVVSNPVAGIVPLTSPFIDSAGAAYYYDWYVGDPKKQFIWKEIWPLQTFQQRTESDAHFERDTVARYKVRYYGGLNAIDTVWFLKVNATS